MTDDIIIDDGFFTYNDEWKEKYIHPEALGKDWELSLEEYSTQGVGRDIFFMPLFTPKFCKILIGISNQANLWTNARHINYPTNDIELGYIKFQDIYKRVLSEFVYPAVCYGYGAGRWNGDSIEEGVDDNNIYQLGSFEAENFLVKYVAGSSKLDENGNKISISRLPVHTDNSQISFSVSLNTDFIGGGCWFPRQKALMKPPVGYLMFHPGIFTHRHGAREVLKGERYVIITFAHTTNDRESGSIAKDGG